MNVRIIIKFSEKQITYLSRYINNKIKNNILKCSVKKNYDIICLFYL
jgi:hypothetical protein